MKAGFCGYSVVPNSLQPQGLQHAKLPCPSPSPGVCSNSCPLSQWCHLTISFSVVPFSSCLQSFPALGSFPLSQFFASGGQSIGALASASVLSMNIQGWFPLRLAGLISMQPKGLSKVLLGCGIADLDSGANLWPRVARSRGWVKVIFKCGRDSDHSQQLVEGFT